MIIFGYYGDVRRIFRTFLGLNQRLNSILLDKRLHLLTDVLSLGNRYAPFHNYYDSDVFHKISYELSIVNGPVNEQKLRQCFQSLMSFHIQQLYKQSGDELQSNLRTFEILRQQLTNDEIIILDKELYKMFINFKANQLNIDHMKRIESLVLKKGARLECSDSKPGDFNLAVAINRLLNYELYMNSNNQEVFDWKVRMFKAVLSSNPHLLSNRDYVIYASGTVLDFLFDNIYRLRFDRYYHFMRPINIKCYQAVVHLTLFAIQCQRLQSDYKIWAEYELFHILHLIPASDLINRTELFIASAQWAILEIITDIHISTGLPLWDDELNYNYQSYLDTLMKKNRTDVILFLYHHPEHMKHFFRQSCNSQEIIKSMTKSPQGRDLLKTLINEKALAASKELVFMLLQKKERKLFEHLVRLSPSLVHQLDEDGNNPLLHICLKVRGCRHRFVEFLIKMKSDLQRRNVHGQNFFDVIKLRRNQELLEKLDLQGLVDTDDAQTKP